MKKFALRIASTGLLAIALLAPLAQAAVIDDTNDCVTHIELANLQADLAWAQQALQEQQTLIVSLTVLLATETDPLLIQLYDYRLILAQNRVDELAGEIAEIELEMTKPICMPG